VVVALAVVLAWGNGLLVRALSVDLQFFGETADRSDYRVAAGGAFTTAALLLLALVVVVLAKGPTWLAYLTGFALATQLALGLTAWSSSRAVDESVVLTKSMGDGASDALLIPGSWPLLVVLFAALVLRARSSRSPR
jgi:hypothetical protein